MKSTTVLVPDASEVAFTTHPRGHFSDLEALYLAKRYGKKVTFLNPAEARRAGWTGKLVMIGRNGDFDEHGESRPKDCEATLMAKELGIAERPELKALLAYAYAVDVERQGKGTLQIGNVVELLYDSIPEPQWYRVQQWADVFFDAYLDSQFNRVSLEVKTQEVVDLIWQAWRNVEKDFTDIEKQATLKFLGGIRSRLGQPFGLPMCVALIWRHWKRTGIKKTPLRWAEDAIRAELVKQKMFFGSAAEFAHSFMAEITVSGKQAFVLGAETDNIRIQSYAFSAYGEQAFGNVVAVAVKRSNGQTLVCRKPRGQMVELWSAVAQIRAHEQELRGVPLSSWSELIAQRGPKGAECWFFQQGAQRLMNGSLTAPEDEPTKQPLKEIWDRLVWGIADEFGEFRREFAASVDCPR